VARLKDELVMLRNQCNDMEVENNNMRRALAEASKEALITENSAKNNN
jgi:hypothetical protein